MQLARQGALLPSSYPLPHDSRRRFLRRARRALALARADGVGRGTSELLERLVDGAQPWPPALRLVESAGALADGWWVRLCTGHCLIAAGRGEEALLVFRELVACAAVPDWRAFEGLAKAHEVAGRTRLALGAMDAAADDPDCGVEPLLAGLYLGIRAGDRRRAERAAARIDLLADPKAPEFAAALARLREWRRRLCGPGPLAGAADTERLLAELTRGGSSPAERVGRAIA